MRVPVLFVMLAACGSKSPSGSLDAPVTGDATPIDVAISHIDAIDKSGACASAFGTSLTPAFGRLDGTVLAIVPPGDQACTAPNATHLVVQATMGGQAYRLVIDVLSNQGSPDIWFDELDAPLIGPTWADGWHAGMSLDYVTNLAVHNPMFTEMHEGDLVAKITSEIDLGAHLSIFATATSAEPDSAHLVHRNKTNADGAIVINPDGASPHYMLMAFGEQVF